MCGIIRLINDDYSLIQDTRFLINKLVPGGLAGLFSSSVKNVLSLVSAGTSNQAVSYLQLYLDGSKQKILDYHRPQIAAKLIAMTKDMPLGGELSLDMMYRTCGTQLNIDYESEVDFIKKFRVVNSIVPISISLFSL